MHWWTLGLKGEKEGWVERRKRERKREREREKERERDAPSDRQRDEAVVLLDVAFENVRTGAQDALEARSVQLHALQWAAGDHGGGAWAVHQQSDLTWRDTQETVNP